MKWILLFVGAILVLLGCLWFVQGVGLVEIQPILCFADCEVITGGSTAWTITGLIAACLGAAALWFARRRFQRARDLA